jgi:hypothetical protein
MGSTVAVISLNLLIRPDGYVAWVGDLSQLGLADALTTWFGEPGGVVHADSSKRP